MYAITSFLYCWKRQSKKHSKHILERYDGGTDTTALSPPYSTSKNKNQKVDTGTSQWTRPCGVSYILKSQSRTLFFCYVEHFHYMNLHICIHKHTIYFFTMFVVQSKSLQLEFCLLIYYLLCSQDVINIVRCIKVCRQQKTVLQ